MIDSQHEVFALRAPRLWDGGQNLLPLGGQQNAYCNDVLSPAGISGRRYNWRATGATSLQSDPCAEHVPREQRWAICTASAAMRSSVEWLPFGLSRVRYIA